MELPDISKLDTFVPAKADLDHCPLCLNKWQIVEENGKTGKVYFACMRQKCMISIWVRDPILGRWTRVESEECPVCKNGNRMRLFFRSDGYIKMVCPKCSCMIENVDDEKHQRLIEAEEKAGKRKTIKGLPKEDKT